LVARFRGYGILSNDIVPTEAALVTMVSLVDKFKDDADFRMALYWFLQASRFGRYSGRAPRPSTRICGMCMMPRRC
jgi:hypothetical protein